MAKYSNWLAFGGKPHVVEWGIPEKIMQNAAQPRWPWVNMTPRSKVIAKSNFGGTSPLFQCKTGGGWPKVPTWERKVVQQKQEQRPKSTPLKWQTNVLVVILVASVPFNTSPVSVLKANPCSGETKVADHLQDHRHRQSGLPTLTWVFKDVTNEFLLSTSWQAVETILTRRPTNGLRVMGWKEKLSVNSLFA